MARYTGPRVRVSRRLGFNVFENKKGDKALQDRPYPPGENGRKRMRETDYGTQLKEKQKVRYMYGIMEKQFRNYYKQAARKKGVTGTNLLQYLEGRLDNVVYRLGFASTRSEARQLVSHKAVKVNESVVNIPSYQVSVGDTVSLTDKSKNQDRVKQALEISASRPDCDWLKVDKNDFSGVYNAVPERDQLDSDINENLIVELYSK